MKIRRICWDCKDAPVTEWKVLSTTQTGEGCLVNISCVGCKKETRVYGWMIGCECPVCKSRMIGAGK
jgi:hypothetical protein